MVILQVAPYINPLLMGKITKIFSNYVNSISILLGNCGYELLYDSLRNFSPYLNTPIPPSVSGCYSSCGIGNVPHMNFYTTILLLECEQGVNQRAQ